MTLGEFEHLTIFELNTEYLLNGIIFVRELSDDGLVLVAGKIDLNHISNPHIIESLLNIMSFKIFSTVDISQHHACRGMEASPILGAIFVFLIPRFVPALPSFPSLTANSIGSHLVAFEKAMFTIISGRASTLLLSSHLPTRINLIEAAITCTGFVLSYTKWLIRRVLSTLGIV